MAKINFKELLLAKGEKGLLILGAVALVLAANLFADGVRDAFDPRSRAFRPRVSRRKPKAEAETGAAAHA